MVTPRRAVLSALAASCAVALGAVDCAALLDIPQAQLVDAAAVDGSDGATEGPVDASVDTGPPYCKTVTPAPQLCSDFDEKEGPFTGWANEGQNPNPGLLSGGALVLDKTLAVSAPFSLSSTTPPLTSGGDNSGAFLLAQLPIVPAIFDLAAEVYISKLQVPPGTSGTSLAAVLYGDQMADGAALFVDSEGAALSLETDPTRYALLDQDGNLAGPFPENVWIAIDISFTNPPGDDAGSDAGDAGALGSVSITANGPGGYNGTATATVPLAPATAPFYAVIGLQATGPMPAAQINLDNVFLRYR